MVLADRAKKVPKNRTYLNLLFLQRERLFFYLKLSYFIKKTVRKASILLKLK